MPLKHQERIHRIKTKDDAVLFLDEIGVGYDHAKEGSLSYMTIFRKHDRIVAAHNAGIEALDLYEFCSKFDGCTYVNCKECTFMKN